MGTFQQSTTTRHEYRMKGVQRTILLIVGAAGVLGGLAMITVFAKDPSRSAPVLLVLFFTAFGIYMLESALFARLVIDQDHIEVRGAFRERSAEASEIEGYRTISSRNGSFTKFFLKQGSGTFTMPNSFAVDDAYRAWLQKIPNLDNINRDALLNEISQQQDLGATPEERLATLSQAKTSSILALVVACAAAVAANFGAPALEVPFAVVLALVPVALLLMIQRSPLLYTAFKRKADPRADLCYALMAATFGLLLRARGIHLVSLQSVGVAVVLITLVYCAVFFRSYGQSPSPVGTGFIMILFGFMYSFGLVSVADALGDNSKVSVYSVQVTGKHSTTGRSTSYILELAPWGPMQRSSNLGVSRTMYDQFVTGDQVCLALHDGRLHAPWYAQVSCTAPSPDLVQ